MDSPLMYDLPPKTSAKNLKVKCSFLQVSGNPSDLPDLNTPEVSFDLHGFIKVKEPRRLPVVLEDPETLLADILSEDSKSTSPVVIAKGISQLAAFPTIHIPGLNLTSHMPHSSGQVSDHYANEASSRIKQEPAIAELASSNSPLFAGFSGVPQLPVTGIFPDVDSSSSQGLDNSDADVRVSSKTGKSNKKNLDKDSEEYRKRRERNNIAVRKSREKAKQRSKDTEKRVYELVNENDKIKKRVELLNRELSVLKGLLANFDASIEGFSNEMGIAKR